MQPALQLLGPPRRRNGEAWMDLPLRQSLLLAAYLAHRDDWVGRDELLTLFWPDEAESTARHNLSQLVYHCRRQPWFEGLEAERTRLRWQVASDLQLFRAAIGAGAWHDALAAYRGALLEGLPAGVAPGFAAWLETERESLQVAWREAVLQVAGVLEREGRASEAVALLATVLERDPLAEDALQVYLRCARGVGQRATALRAYEAFRVTLRDELELEPLDETVALASALRAGNAEAEEASAPAAPREPAPPAARAAEPPVLLRGFPKPATPFVGREAELEALHGMLVDGGERLVTLLGPGGVGKTRLALQAGRRAAAAFADGALFVPLAALDDPAYLARAIGAALGLEPSTTRSDEVALIAALESRSLLLVLDNLEHIVAGTGPLVELLAASPGSSLLLTSQEPLDFPGEVHVTVAGMAYPTESTASPEGFDAVKLFLRSARRAHPQFVATPADHAGISRLCRLLEGLPLGLELAAAWMRLMRPAEVADALEESLDALVTRHHDVPARHRSLRAMLDHAWSLLGDEERAALAGVGPFRGGFTREAAEAVAGASLRTLLALVNKSLLRRTHGGRFEALEVVRRYGAERLAAGADRHGAVARAHAAHFVAFGLRAAPELIGAERATWLERVAEEHDNLRAAFGHLIKTGDVESGMRLAHALSQYWWLRGHYREARATLDALLRLERPRAPALQAQALGLAGNFARLCEDFEAARALYEASLAIKRAGDDPTATAVTLGNLGNLLRLLGDLDGAERHLEEALALFRGAGEGRQVANTLNNLGALAAVGGDRAAAERRYLEGLAAARAAGEELVAALALGNLGAIARERGDLEGARARHAEAGEVFDRLGYRVGQAVTAQYLGDVALRAGDLTAARDGYALAMARFAQIDDRRGVAEVAGSLVDLAVAARDWAAALRWLGATHGLHERLGIARPVAVLAALDAHEARARAEIGVASAAALREEGASWTAEEAVARATVGS
jgi:predicted ATPase/DNA-binding SARP family transcriptional activator